MFLNQSKYTLESKVKMGQAINGPMYMGENY